MLSRAGAMLFATAKIPFPKMIKQEQIKEQINNHIMHYIVHFWSTLLMESFIC
jgi:hypothetical protein